MIWVAAAVLAVLALVPAAVALGRRVRVRGRRDVTVELYRAQIGELDRDLAERRISASDHATALLEVQRRLLAEAAGVGESEQGESERAGGSRLPLVVGLGLVPVAALGLYLIGGRPDLPAQPLAGRMAAADRQMADVTAMADQLREVLAKVDPGSEKGRDGEVLLGNLEAEQGDFSGAAAAWSKALAVRFDPLLAAQIADATSRSEGRVSEASAALFRRALAAAPADAPWRGQVEQRLSGVAN